MVGHEAPRALLACALLVAGCGRIDFEPTSESAFQWQRQGPALRFYEVFGFAPDDIYAVGLASEIYHSTGDGTWTPQPTGLSSSFFGIHGTANDLYAVGNPDLGSPGIVRSSGDGTWTRESNTLPNTLNKPWLVAPNEVHVVGYDGLIGRSPGDGTWTSETSGTVEPLLTIWASGPGDLYAGGYNGVILHSVGNGTWQPQNTGTTTRIVEIWGRSATDIYAVGHAGLILHSTGDGTWQPQDSGTTMPLFAILGTPDSLYICGSGPAILQSRGDGVWTEIGPAIPFVTADALWRDGQRLYVATDVGILVGTPD